ncbi:hypothetical protein [Roseivivax sp. CAU 1761]
MKALVFVANFFLPGVGTLIMGNVGVGLIQLVMYMLGLIFTVFTLGFGLIIGGPVMLIAWIWGLVSALSAPDKPLEVVLTQQNHDGTATPVATSSAGTQAD